MRKKVRSKGRMKKRRDQSEPSREVGGSGGEDGASGYGKAKRLLAGDSVGLGGGRRAGKLQPWAMPAVQISLNASRKKKERK